jgi:hypothetical protein
MNDQSQHRYDVTVTINKDSVPLPGPAEFASAAEQAASTQGASVMSAHTAEKIISVVTVAAASRPAAMAIALVVVSDALRQPTGLGARGSSAKDDM